MLSKSLSALSFQKQLEFKEKDHVFQTLQAKPFFPKVKCEIYSVIFLPLQQRCTFFTIS